MAVKFDEEAIRLMVLFESLTGSLVRDCVIDKESNTVYMVVESGELGTAIGRNGRKIRAVEELVKRRIKLLEFTPDVAAFAKAAIPQACKVNSAGELLEIWVDRKYRPAVVGREGKNLNLLKRIFQRNYNIKDLIIR